MHHILKSLIFHFASSLLASCLNCRKLLVSCTNFEHPFVQLLARRKSKRLEWSEGGILSIAYFIEYLELIIRVQVSLAKLISYFREQRPSQNSCYCCNNNILRSTKPWTNVTGVSNVDYLELLFHYYFLRQNMVNMKKKICEWCWLERGWLVKLERLRF